MVRDAVLDERECSVLFAGAVNGCRRWGVWTSRSESGFGLLLGRGECSLRDTGLKPVFLAGVLVLNIYNKSTYSLVPLISCYM